MESRKLSKSEFMSMYINDKYRKRYEERRKLQLADNFICEQSMDKGKVYTKKKNLRR